MKFQFGYDVLTLPGAILSHTDANAVQLRVILWLASDLTLARKPRQLAKLADCDPQSALDAMAFWAERGVLTEGEAIPAMARAAEDAVAVGSTKKTVQQAAAPKTADAEISAPTAPRLERADELPTYTSTELADLLEKRDALRSLVDEAQQILGKMFNPSEINILVGMNDYLGLPAEGILLLLSHCMRMGKNRLRAIEKYAYRLVDRGITTPEELEEEFRTVEAMRGFEGEVRQIFGLNSRSLTGKEEKMLREWLAFGYSADVVRLAYEITIHATSKPSIPYAHSILQRWHEEGHATLADIERAEQAKKEQKSGDPTALGNSFDTDDLFRAALARSFRETGAQDGES